MKNYCANVTVVCERILKVSFNAKNKPTKKQMLFRLNQGDYNDIIDEEDVEIKDVLKIGDYSEEECEEEE